MDVIRTTVDDFDSICRICMCDCKNVISFNVNGTLISNIVVSEVLSKYASIQVSGFQYEMLIMLFVFTLILSFLICDGTRNNPN